MNTMNFLYGACAATLVWLIVFYIWAKFVKYQKEQTIDFLEKSNEFINASKNTADAFKELQKAFSKFTNPYNVPIKELSFTSKQCVEITSKEQFNRIRHIIGADKLTDSLVDTIYLEHKRNKIAFTFSPFSSINGKEYEVISLEQAILR